MTNNRPHILILEDDCGFGELYKEAFSDFAEITLCADGLRGERLFLENLGRYDLVILDDDMPRKNGMDILEKICSYEKPLRLMISDPKKLEAVQAHAKVRSYNGLGFVKKSDNIGMLIKIVGELLNNNNSATLDDYFRSNYGDLN